MKLFFFRMFRRLKSFFSSFLSSTDRDAQTHAERINDLCRKKGWEYEIIGVEIIFFMSVDGRRFVKAHGSGKTLSESIEIVMKEHE
jgi:hypothetical protein